MLLKDSIFKAKKLFNNTLQSFKEFLSGGYQRLPKSTHPFAPFSCGATDSKKLRRRFRELNNFYKEFSLKWESAQDQKTKKKKKKKLTLLKTKTLGKEDDIHGGSFLKFANVRSVGDEHIKREAKEKKEEEEEEEEEEEKLRMEMCCIVAEGLKELELMDASNMEHTLDVEEILHYCSRITSPFYVDIFNRFFMETYAELLSQTFCRPHSCCSPHKTIIHPKFCKACEWQCSTDVLKTCSFELVKHHHPLKN